MLRILAAIVSVAKRLDARLTNGVEMHGRCLTGLDKARPARRAALRRRPTPKHRSAIIAAL